MTVDIRAPRPDFLAFWREHHWCTLTTRRPDGTPHLVPVGVTYDPEARLARVITGRRTVKVANILAAERAEQAGQAGRAGQAGLGGVRVAVCQVAKGRWSTLEGRARIRTGPEEVTEAVRRYTERYLRAPRENPERVVIEIAVDRAIGRGLG
ncbi:pyridoxamine 5'-phosphate oxidase family protein [Streptomyces sp. NPDC093085]|uniref:pyridoxamine 5'-phosphate oxidase family protein n=1 Tax=Streptomyces sp. NPDC093085 TaxID=3155068 RepID=UPI003435A10B